MYSGETIELEELWDNQKYDIDHIFPQSKVMDDSLDNRVLVKKKCNQMKEDKYPIDETVRKKMQPFWKSLVDAGLISEEKYKRLIRGNGFEPSELAGFISRQLVETRQSTKAAASILQQVISHSVAFFSRIQLSCSCRQSSSKYSISSAERKPAFCFPQIRNPCRLQCCRN